MKTITVPTDAVTLHRGELPPTAPAGTDITDDMLAEQIGAAVIVNRPGSVRFPAYAGTPTPVYIVGWHEGRARWCHEVGERNPLTGRPHEIKNGDVVSTRLPVTATISPV